MSQGSVLYRIDAVDRLIEVNDGWSAFAGSNGAPALDPHRVLGREIWRFIADDTTTHLYQVMAVRLRSGGAPIRFTFRCDAPNHRRLLAMEMTGEADGVICFLVTTVTEEARPAVPLLDPSRQAGPQMLVMCGWCKRVKLPDDIWADVEDAVRQLDLFDDAGALPQLTHGMCAECYKAMSTLLDDELSPPGRQSCERLLPE